MADTKVSALVNAAALDGTEEFHIVQAAADRAASVLQMSTFTRAAIAANSLYMNFGSGFFVLGHSAEIQTRLGVASRTPRSQIVTSSAGADMLLARFSTNPTATSTIFFAHAKHGTIGTYAPVASGDYLGLLSFAGSDATKFNEGARMTVEATGAPGADYTPARIFFSVSTGSAAAAESLGLGSDGSLTLGGTANLIMTATRHPILRPYTVATLPSATPPWQLIAVTDGTGNKRLAISDGTNWRFPDGAIVS